MFHPYYSTFGDGDTLRTPKLNTSPRNAPQRPSAPCDHADESMSCPASERTPHSHSHPPSAVLVRSPRPPHHNSLDSPKLPVDYGLGSSRASTPEPPPTPSVDSRYSSPHSVDHRSPSVPCNIQAPLPPPSSPLSPGHELRPHRALTRFDGDVSFSPGLRSMQYVAPAVTLNRSSQEASPRTHIHIDAHRHHIGRAPPVSRHDDLIDGSSDEHESDSDVGFVPYDFRSYPQSMEGMASMSVFTLDTARALLALRSGTSLTSRPSTSPVSGLAALSLAAAAMPLPPTQGPHKASSSALSQTRPSSTSLSPLSPLSTCTSPTPEPSVPPEASSSLLPNALPDVPLAWQTSPPKGKGKRSLLTVIPDPGPATTSVAHNAHNDRWHMYDPKAELEPPRKKRRVPAQRKKPPPPPAPVKIEERPVVAPPLASTSTSTSHSALCVKGARNPIISVFEIADQFSGDYETARLECQWAGCEVRGYAAELWKHIKAVHRRDAAIAKPEGDAVVTCGWCVPGYAPCSYSAQASKMWDHLIGVHQVAARRGNYAQTKLRCQIGTCGRVTIESEFQRHMEDVHWKLEGTVRWCEGCGLWKRYDKKRLIMHFHACVQKYMKDEANRDRPLAAPIETVEAMEEDTNSAC